MREELILTIAVSGIGLVIDEPASKVSKMRAKASLIKLAGELRRRKKLKLTEEDEASPMYDMALRATLLVIR